MITKKLFKTTVSLSLILILVFSTSYVPAQTVAEKPDVSVGEKILPHEEKAVVQLKGIEEQKELPPKAVYEDAYSKQQVENIFDTGTNRFIIKYKNSNSRNELNNKLKNRFKGIRNLKSKRNFDLVYTDKGMTKEELLNSIGKSEVEYIQQDFEMTLSSNDTYFDSQWGVYNKDTISATYYNESEDGSVADSVYTDVYSSQIDFSSPPLVLH